MPIKPGERVSVKAPGGGGYGDPKKRDRRAIVDDVVDGFISREKAKADYGFDDRWVAAYGGDAPSDKAAE